MTHGHLSVLLTEAVEGLEIKADDVVVDATIGGAGHFGVLLQKLSPKGTLIGIDADHEAIERAEAVVAHVPDPKPRICIQENNFRNFGDILENCEVEAATKVLFDLGWSGFQLARGRGFSFQADEPLLMTYGDPEAQETAADLVNSAPEETIADILYSLGEEQFSRKIAKGIVEARKQERILTTFQLVSVIQASTPSWYQHRRLHPATKTFQALRMYVNDELGALRDGLSQALTHTKDGGRIAVITFHSIEDRVVKNMFRDAVEAGNGALVTKKPIVPSDAELLENPRARSAKLRIFERGTTIARPKFTHSRSLYA